MRSTKATRWLSGTLAALLLAQGMCLPAGAWSWGGWGSWGDSSQTSQVETQEAKAEVQLQSGTAIIPADADEAAVKQALFDALVVNKDGVDPQSLNWEYQCYGTKGYVGIKDWVSINGKADWFGSYLALSANKDGNYPIRLENTKNAVTLTKATKLSSSITLTEGISVALPYNDNAQVDYNTLRQNIFNAVVASTNPELTLNDVTIEYYTKAVTDADAKYVALEGETITVLGVPLTYPAISKGEQKIRISYAGTDTIYGTSAETTVTIVERPEAPYTLKETPYTVALAVDEDMNVDYDAVHDAIFNAVVASSDILTADNVTIEYYYKGITELDSKWLPLEGQDVVGDMGYPAISVGEQKVRISWPGSQNYAPTTIEATITVTSLPAAPYTLKETPDAVTLAVGSDMKVDYNLLETAIFNAVVASSEVIKANDVTVEYYYNGVTELDSKWLPLEGQAVVGDLGYPAISAGSQKIRISWPGNQQYAPTTIEATVQVNDREQVQFTLNGDGENYEVGMVFNVEQGYDYAATAKAIYNAVVASTVNPEGLTADDVTVEYNVDKTGITDSFKPLNETDATGFVKFGTGTWEIRISWAGSQTYRGNHVDVNVTTTDNRLASAVALKSGASFTYNMDANAMKQAIFDNVIDWTNSTLPAKETLSLDDFVIEYKAKLTDAESGVDLGLEDLEDLFGKIPGMDDFLNNDILTQWVPLEGKVYSIGDTVLGKFPQIGAGENQSIRISYKGNADYRPSETTEGTVTVNKAKVSVKVNSTNIYADELVPANFITTDPADEFDIYTIYAGVTSSVSTGVYLDLPDRYTNNAVLELLDPIVEKLYGKSFTEMMNDGVTVGELRELFSTQELLDLLDKLNIDTGTFGQILSVINKLPGVMDSVRIGFGTPNRAGLYTVTAITDNKNYETGVGFGFLLTKMRFSGPKLTWNDEILNGKLTAEQAQNFNFGATLWYNGEPVEDQSSVHYLYSGFTSSWRVYSSTTTAPTEPGRYVVTVCILGGNYMAAPITRSFQITK
ncbi:hypothetical protein HMPREF0866_00780 [Ruminococcaceae bacterium D16]|nr:hypothetical protein HMPREF0866_00780 [Ruminococcaceae bacterium D16]